MFDKLIRQAKVLATNLIIEVSTVLLDRLYTEDDEMIVEEEHPVEPQEQTVETVDEPQEHAWLVTTIYNMVPLTEDEELQALCVKVIDMVNGNQWWVPYMYVEFTTGEPKNIE